MAATIRLAVTVAIALAANGPGALLADSAGAPVVEVGRLDRAPTLEDFIAMAPPPDLADRMARAGGHFIQRFPTDGRPSARRTDVYLGYDDHDLYAVFVAFDDEPHKIRATLGRRESVFGDDIVQIMLDTFGDQRRAYSFICNPLGVQFDAIWTEGSEFDSSFDTVWRSRGALTDRGYVVWMAIPFRSLRFPRADEQVWGLLFNRDIPRDNEETFWPEYSLRIQGRLNQMGRLRGLHGISPGRNVQVIPYGTVRRYRVLDEVASGRPEFVSDRADPDAGVDAKFVLRDRLVVDLTANPDFSQVESDEPQVTANSRFELFFPEKRPFFLENAGTFATPLDLVFTRRIGEPRAGARLTGKLGPWSLGALTIDDEAPGVVLPPGEPGAGERARFHIARVSRDVGRQSTVGLLVTSRVFAGASNLVASADARVKWNENWTSNLQAARSRSNPASGPAVEDAAYDLSIQRDGEHFFGSIRHLDLGPDFRADAGFVPRVDLREWRTTVRYTFRPGGRRLLSWGPRAFLRRNEDHEGTRLDRSVEAGMGFEFPRQTRVAFDLAAGRERVRPSEFVALDEADDFAASGFDLSVSSAPTDRWRFEAYGFSGRTANFSPASGPPVPADQIYGEASLSYRPLPNLRLDLGWIGTRLDDDRVGARIFSNSIVRLKGNLQLSTSLSLRGIVERDDLVTSPQRTSLEPGSRLNADLLVSYLVNPWTAVYAGVNSNWRDRALVVGRDGGSPAREPARRVNDARQVFIKVSYLFSL